MQGNADKNVCATGRVYFDYSQYKWDTAPTQANRVFCGKKCIKKINFRIRRMLRKNLRHFWWIGLLVEGLTGDAGSATRTG